ncbi:hypothetical protein D3C79_869940 [compost metagenome]
MPGVLAIGCNGGHTLLKAHPPRRWLVFGTGQGLIGELQQSLWRITGAERREADTGHRVDITGTGLMQALQRRFQCLGKVYCLFMHHARR